MQEKISRKIINIKALTTDRFSSVACALTSEHKGAPGSEERKDVAYLQVNGEFVAEFDLSYMNPYEIVDSVGALVDGVTSLPIQAPERDALITVTAAAKELCQQAEEQGKLYSWNFEYAVNCVQGIIKSVEYKSDINQSWAP